MNCRSTWTALALTATMFAGTTHAATLFSQPGSGGKGGNNPFSYDSQFIANEFNLLADSTVTSVVFNSHTNLNTVPITNVALKFYTDNAGTLDTEVFSGNFAAVDLGVTGSTAGYTLKDFRVDLPGVSLAAGTYWLGMRADPAQWAMHWTVAESDTFASDGLQGDHDGNAGSYYKYDFQHVFTINGTVSAVPEPETYGMLLAGLGLLGVAARRRAGASARH